MIAFEKQAFLFTHICDTGMSKRYTKTVSRIGSVKQNLLAHQQHPLNVVDEDGTVLGEFFADLFVENQLIVELKACRALADEHVSQLLGYLRASRIHHGLLINFGSPRIEIRKYILSDAV